MAIHFAAGTTMGTVRRDLFVDLDVRMRLPVALRESG